MDVFPIDALRPRDVEWHLSGQTVTPGRTMSGITPLGRFDGGGHWVCGLHGIQTANDDEVRLARVIEGILDGGAAPIIVPMSDERRAPESGASELTPFSDGVGYSDGSMNVTGAVGAVTTAAAARRAVFLNVALAAGELRGGEHFSILHAGAGLRLHRVLRIFGDTIEFRPPLREAVDAGTDLDFSTPGCVMRLFDPDSVRLRLRFNRWGTISPVFVEHFEPTP